MAKGAKLLEVVYVDTEECVPVLVTIGDSVRGVDWAEKQYPYPTKPDLSAGITALEGEFNRQEYREAKNAIDEKREGHGGLYAIFLGAQRCKLRGSESGDWLEWLSCVTMPDDEDDADDAEAPAAGEPAGPQSEA